MSTFKRMKMVPVDPKSDEITKLYKASAPIKLRRMIDLDTEMNEILNENIDTEAKAKLYSQALRKFLAYKKQHIEESMTDNIKAIDKTKKIGKKKTKNKIKSSPKKGSKHITKPKTIKTPKIKGLKEKKTLKIKKPKVLKSVLIEPGTSKSPHKSKSASSTTTQPYQEVYSLEDFYDEIFW